MTSGSTPPRRTLDGVIDAFLAWVAEGSVDPETVDPDGAVVALVAHTDCTGRNVGHWMAGDVGHALHHMTAEGYRDLAAGTLSALLLYLSTTGLMAPDSDPLPSLLQELVNTATRPEADEPVDPPTLLPVQLADECELATAVRRSVLYRRLRGLLAWVGDGRGLTASSHLPRRKELRELCTATGLVEDPAVAERVDRTRSAADIPAVDLMWALGQGSTVVTVTGATARPGPGAAALTGTDDAALLDLWDTLFDHLVSVGPVGPASAWGPEVDVELPGMLFGLYQADGPVPLDAFIEAVGRRQDLTEMYDEHPVVRDMVAEAVRTSFEELSRAGATVLTESAVELTPLGVWVVRQGLLHNGFTAPLVGELADRPAEDLLEQLAVWPEEVVRAECAAWVSRRPAVTAATELLQAAIGGPPARRGMCFVALDQIGLAAMPAVREWAVDPVLTPYAKVWLATTAGKEPELTPDEAGMMTVDLWAAMIDTHGPEMLTGQLGELGQADQQALFVSTLGSVEHPRRDEVLEVLAVHHPDSAVRRAAQDVLNSA